MLDEMLERDNKRNMGIDQLENEMKLNTEAEGKSNHGWLAGWSCWLTPEWITVYIYNTTKNRILNSTLTFQFFLPVVGSSRPLSLVIPYPYPPLKTQLNIYNILPIPNFENLESLKMYYTIFNKYENKN